MTYRHPNGPERAHDPDGVVSDKASDGSRAHPSTDSAILPMRLDPLSGTIDSRLDLTDGLLGNAKW